MDTPAKTFSAAAVVLILGTAVYAQDKYALTSPSGSRSPTSGDTRMGGGLVRADR